MSFDLSGRKAFVTGCRRGIGKGAALALAAAGADIVGTSLVLSADDPLGDEIRSYGRQFSAYRADLGDRHEVHRLAGTVIADVGDLDILVLNAGTIARCPAVDHGDDLWDRVLEVNLTAPFILARELGRQMLERRSGKVIFTASMLSFQGGMFVPSYSASKSGIAAITRALANEWAPFGVNVNAIAPGYMATDNTQALREDPVRSQQILQRIPAGRWGEPADLAGAFVFLASAASDYVHGTVLPVDGGWLAR